MNEYLVFPSYSKSVKTKLVRDEHVFRPAQEPSVHIDIAYGIYSLENDKRILIDLRITVKAYRIIQMSVLILLKIPRIL